MKTNNVSLRINLIVALLAASGSLTLATELPINELSPSRVVAEAAKIDSYLTEFLQGVNVKKQFLNKMGETISCVDIHNQPSMNHPQIGRGHIVQTKPSPQLLAVMPGNWIRDIEESLCPVDSVEMILPTRERIARAGTLREYLSGKRNADNAIQPTISTSGEDVSNLPSPAIGAGGRDYSIAFKWISSLAVQSSLAVPKPRVANLNEQSISQVWLTGGSGNLLQTIEFGSIVSYQVNNDSSNPHFFSYFTPDNYQSGCYNDRCPGFIRVSTTTLNPAQVLSSSSGNSLITAGVVLDPGTKNWILYKRSASSLSSGTWVIIGYYPASIFNAGQMSRNATYLAVGGEVFGQVDGQPHTSTQMGNGEYGYVHCQANWIPGSSYYCSFSNGQATYYMNTGYQKLDGTTSYLNYSDMSVRSTRPNCYSGAYSDVNIFNFGGPGRNDPYCQ